MKIQKWEYLHVTLKISSGEADNSVKLNELGDQGWELMFVKECYTVYTGKFAIFYFKRPKA